MSHNRLGTLSAGVLGLGWLLAVAVNVSWLPQIQTMPPDFWEDSELFLRFVRENALTWRVFHVGTTAGLMALVFLVPLLSALNGEDSRAGAFTAVGLVGAAAGLLASLIDHLGTPALARFSAGNPVVAYQIWEFVEPWRDAGLKAVSYWFLGFWLLWVAGAWLRLGVLRLGRFSQLIAAALLLLAFTKTIVPPPLSYTLSEAGLGGLAILFLPVWGLWTARWFWQREVAEG